ncbi:MAG: NAD(P)-dependent oxidoreductase [Bacteroidia bacterium]|nr:NAD(P)-dependent oxidoreductase [Bacteroidia bacterium]MCO5254448.1 NAD(P)-dependent oxidoreductase [Bacteroidota bacterium]MCZ2130008.1 NAD(P)-dependent oxidoreductase [Bacteroidia bacterium]
MKILLTGATGFLGYRTLEKLITLDWVKTVIANGTKLLDYRGIENTKVIYKLGRLENSVFVDELVNGVDMIIHAASFSSPWGKAAEFNSSNIITQQNILSSAKKYGVQKIIYISSPSVYFDGTHRLNIKETDPLPLKFVNHYARTKREAEILLEQSNIPFVILRPRALIGRGDSIIMPRLIRAQHEGKLRVIGNGKNKVDLTAVENVVEAIILSCLVKNEGLNQCYNITNDEPVILWEQIKYVLNALETPLVDKSISYRTAHLIARFLETKSVLTNYKEPPLTCYSVGTLGLSFTLDITKAKQLLGYRPTINTQQAIDEFLNWYKSNAKL